MLGEIIKRGITIDGMALTLWNHDTDEEYTIMTYPKAKHTSYTSFGPERGKTFCCPLNVGIFGYEIFNDLQEGKLTLRDCWKYFHEPSKHGYCLGYIENETWSYNEWLQWKDNLNR